MPHPDPPTEPTSAEGGAGGPSAEQRLAEVAKAYRALQADNEGYRARMARNAERRYAQRHESLLLKFIDILDNLDRALAAAETNPAGTSLIEGLILVRTQLLQTLQEEGLERIGVVGIPYDPEVAEAVGTQPVDDPDHHHIVIKDIRRGYRLNGRLARAAQVIVGEYEGERPAAAEPSDRIEVVQEGVDDDTGSIAALAAQAAAAVGGASGDEERTGDHGVISDEVSLEDAAQEAVAAAAGDDDVPTLDAGADADSDGEEDSLEAAAREAAAMAGEDESELTVGVTTEIEVASDDDVISDADSLEDAAQEAVAAAAGDDEGESLQAAAREAASVAEDDETEAAAAPEIDDDSGGDVISDGDTLEDAAREAAAMLGGADAEPAEAEPAADPPPSAGSADAPERSAARRRIPAHPLDDVDPDAFDGIGDAAPDDPDAARDDEGA